MDCDQRLQDLHKAYADMMLDASKEASAKVLAAEMKSQRLEHELHVTKAEAVRMMVRLKKMMDDKISEEKMTSWNQQQKINEVEAQLHEAEDIVTELREELKHVQAKCERESRNDMQHLDKHDNATLEEAFEDNRQSQSLPCHPLELDKDSLIASNKENLYVNQGTGYLECSGEVIQMRNLHVTMPELPSILRRSKEDKFISCSYEAQAIDLMLKAAKTATGTKFRKKKPALNKRIPDKLFRKLHETPGVALSDHTSKSVENSAQTPLDLLVPIVQEGASTECLDIQVSKSNLNKVDESIPPPELKTTGATSKGSSVQLFKYTFQRKRKRETVGISDGNVSSENFTPERKKEKKNISEDP
ncbi:hypothetical protein POM88_051055 [Heracleum sosnowskyi]|uniref:Uncharacterized protein n=1 Tax=Heracleum sosnowskyi TaxID=360622 RepID=A0AAD8M304_9APIA|nr:hypothetical protein POM88_051055 [Heracleum sosnowskyi]